MQKFIISFLAFDNPISFNNYFKALTTTGSRQKHTGVNSFNYNVHSLSRMYIAAKQGISHLMWCYFM